MKSPITKKIKFNIGDLVVDKNNVESGLIVQLLKNHVKIMWGEQTKKISRWQLQNGIVITKIFQYYPKRSPKVK